MYCVFHVFSFVSHHCYLSSCFVSSVLAFFMFSRSVLDLSDLPFFLCNVTEFFFFFLSLSLHPCHLFSCLSSPSVFVACLCIFFWLSHAFCMYLVIYNPSLFICFSICISVACIVLLYHVMLCSTVCLLFANMSDRCTSLSLIWVCCLICLYYCLGPRWSCSICLVLPGHHA